MDCRPPGSSVHGILQTRILEGVVIPFSRGFSRLRDWTWVSCIAGRFFTIWATKEYTHTHIHTYVYCSCSDIYICVCVCVCVWPKYWGFSFSISPSNEYSGLISFRIDWFDLLAVQETLRIFSRLLGQDGGGERCISSPPKRTAKLRMAVSSNQQKDTETHQKTDSPCPEIKIKL